MRPSNDLTIDEKVAIIWSDHFDMQARINRLYWGISIVAAVAFAAGAATERFAKLIEKITQ
jgi:phage tail sheath gpL-like